MLFALTRTAAWRQVKRIWQQHVCQFSSKATLFALLATLLILQPVQAGGVPGLDKRVSINAREIPVDQFLSNLFGYIGVPVVVDAKVQGTVNGSWDNTAGVLLDKATRSFQLVTYFDGITAYVYKDNDLVQQIMPVSGAVAGNIIQYANSLDLTDSRNKLDRVGSNGLRVIGTPRFLEQIKGVSRNFRSKQPKYTPLVVEKLFYLKHAWAQDITTDIGGQSVAIKGIASTLVDLLSDMPIGDSVFPAAVGNGLTRVQPQSSDTGQPTMVAGGTDDNAMALAQPQISSSTLVRQSKHTKIDAKDVRIVAVPRLNAVLIRDLESHMDSYQSLIDSLDVEPYMLEIEATIIDLNSDKSEELGVNWRAQRDGQNEALFGNGTNSDLALRPNTQITPVGNGGILSLAFGDERAKFLARIRALEETGDAEIVSKPHVVTLANVEAILDTTQSFFARVQAAEDAALFKISVGTTLRVTPHVYRDGPDTRIKLLINIQDGATSDATVDAIPVIGQSQISTQAIVKAGDSLLIGGMVRESKRNGETRVPLLGDIPGLGNIFRTKTSSGSKVERLFLITPRLAYKNGFEKRMEGPILQGEADTILDSSGDRLTAAKKLLQTAQKRNVEAAAERLEQIASETNPPYTVEYQDAPNSKVSASNTPSQSVHTGAIKDNLRLPEVPQPAPTEQLAKTQNGGLTIVDDDDDWQEVRAVVAQPATPEPIPVVAVPVREAPVSEVPQQQVPVREIPTRQVPAREVPISELPYQTVQSQITAADKLLEDLNSDDGWQEVVND